MPCKQDHQHPPWPSSGVHDLDIQPCETQCGWCDYEAKGASRANNLRSHARGFAHVSNPDNHSLRGVTILKGKAGRKFRVEENKVRNTVSPQRDSQSGSYQDTFDTRATRVTSSIASNEHSTEAYNGSFATLPNNPDLLPSVVAKSDAPPVRTETSENRHRDAAASEHNTSAIVGSTEPPLPSWTISEAESFDHQLLHVGDTMEISRPAPPNNESSEVFEPRHPQVQSKMIDHLGMETWERQKDRFQEIYHLFSMLKANPDLAVPRIFRVGLRMALDPSCKMQMLKLCMANLTFKRMEMTLRQSHSICNPKSRFYGGEAYMHPDKDICSIDEYLNSPCERVSTTEVDWWQENRHRYGVCMLDIVRGAFTADEYKIIFGEPDEQEPTCERIGLIDDDD